MYWRLCIGNHVLVTMYWRRWVPSYCRFITCFSSSAYLVLPVIPGSGTLTYILCILPFLYCCVCYQAALLPVIGSVVDKLSLMISDPELEKSKERLKELELDSPNLPNQHILPEVRPLQSYCSAPNSTHGSHLLSN